jgi:outer membrane protein OmpA-like peptidoglycan-associated protein
VTTTVPLTVVAELAKITWPTPAPQEGPLTLGAAQLNATCSVPSTLVYDPKLGTVLEPGTYVLKVTCVPTDPKIPSVTTTVTLVITDVLQAPKNAKTSPITFTRGSITWDAVKNAVGYSVDIRGAVVCTTTTETACRVNRTIGPKTPVIVTAIDKDKKTASARAEYFNDKLLTAIEINFATNRFNIDAKAQREVNRVSAIIKREGFTFVEITGHTDPRGGAINIALSKNRAKSLASAMTRLVPGLTFKDAGLAANDPKANNRTAKGMAMNRRSVGAVR